MKKQLIQYIFVIRELVSREIKRKYSRSFLGVLWSVLSPLFNMIVMSLIFTTIFRNEIENFPIYYLTGIILWTLFSGATNAAMTSLIDNKNMLLKVKLPTAIFPLARCCTALANLGYSLIAYIIMLFVFRVKLNVYILLLPMVVILLFLFTFGIGKILSILYVFFGDIQHLYSVILTLWMFCSAIFYPVDRVEGVMEFVIMSNPIYIFIAATRRLVMDAMPPTPREWAMMLLWSFGVYLAGTIYFDKFQNRVMQHI